MVLITFIPCLKIGLNAYEIQNAQNDNNLRKLKMMFMENIFHGTKNSQ